MADLTVPPSAKEVEKKHQNVVLECCLSRTRTWKVISARHEGESGMSVPSVRIH